jgi:HAD superfamily hydrolase (TIGR01509 family)
MIQHADFDHVLLDLDGTILDKYFDDHFWLTLVPQRYAQVHSKTEDEAREFLFKTYHAHEQTLKWTDLDFWSEALGLDIPLMKEELEHLINVHPHAENYLKAMRAAGKDIHLLTNAHHKSVKLKFRKTGIGKYFDSVLTSNELGAPKEQQGYWLKAQELAGFDPARSIFVDDTEACLMAARDFGIRYVVHKSLSSSKETPVASKLFPSIKVFKELLP